MGIDKGNGYFVLKSILILTRKRLEGGGGVGYITQIQSKHTDGVSKYLDNQQSSFHCVKGVLLISDSMMVPAG